MALIPKVEPKQEKKVVSARLDEETHRNASAVYNLPRRATHEYIIAESLKRLSRRDKEFNQWLEKNHAASTATSATSPLAFADKRASPTITAARRLSP